MIIPDDMPGTTNPWLVVIELRLDAAGQLIVQDHGVGVDVAVIGDGQRIGHGSAGQHGVGRARSRQHEIDLTLDRDVGGEFGGVVREHWSPWRR